MLRLSLNYNYIINKSFHYITFFPFFFLNSNNNNKNNNNNNNEASY